ncbi:methylmalonyl-CoA mutase family protein [Algoriphagus sp.]|uniref:methylmalonyl-CoA mutase family protein n=1 Tax=Algoriphagus sp. TaxID=1872435 RepID=UPI00391CE2B7
MIRDLFEDFPSTSKEAWRSQAIRDLKGKDFDQSLNSLLWDEIEIQPFYTKEDLFDIRKFPENTFESAPEVTGLPSRNWANLVAVYPYTTNKQVLNALENGATGLILHLQGNETLEELLKGVLPEYISLLIKPTGDPLTALKSFLAWAKENGADENILTGGLLWSPIDFLFDDGKSWGEMISVLKDILSICPKSPNFKAFHFNFSRYSESGATGLDELIFGFGEVVELIAQSEIDPKVLFEKSGLYTAIGDLHFPEMAKLKAIRLFAVDLARQYDLELNPPEPFIFAKTSEWSKTTLDAHTNLIRQTYEAMAAVLGGANGIWVVPLQNQNASELELRVARNVSSILIHESYLDKVLDPAAGSFYLDFLISQIMKKTRAGLQTLEEKGGWKASFELGEIQQKVKQSRVIQQNQVLSGKVGKIGVNKFPASQKLKNDLEFLPITENGNELKPSRASYLVELQNQTIA